MRWVDSTGPHLVLLEVDESRADGEEGPRNLEHGDDEDRVKQGQPLVQPRHLWKPDFLKYINK